MAAKAGIELTGQWTAYSVKVHLVGRADEWRHCRVRAAENPSGFGTLRGGADYE